MTLVHFCRRPSVENTRNYLGARFRFLADAGETGGAYGLLDVVTRPGLEPPPHTHTHEDEAYVVLNGRWTFRCGDAVTEAEPGALVFLPRGLQHSFTVHDEAARALILITPGGLERHFREHSLTPVDAAPLPPPAIPDVMRAVADVGEYGVVVAAR